MEERIPWLVCRMGKKCCLLAKDEKAFYIIEVGKNLDWETEEWLLRQGVSEALLKELNLAFEYIPKALLRGVALEGNRAGDALYLYLKSERRKLTLELDYEKEQMETFLEGIERFTAPQSHEPGLRGWRKERQNRELFHRLRFVAPAFLIAGAGVSIGYVVTGNWILFTLSLLCILMQLGLAMAMPVYFTIFLPKGKKKQNVWDLGFPLGVMMLILFLRFRLNWMSYHAFWYILPTGAVLGALVYWRVVDLHQQDGGLFSSLILGAFTALVLAGQINEVYDFTPPESYVLEVENLRSSKGKNRSYYCTVTLPDGREVDVSVSRKVYQDLEKGDLVRVMHGTGALGIEYARIAGEE